MYETYLQNEREFDEKFPHISYRYEKELKNGSIVYSERNDEVKSHNRLSIIKVMKALADELEEEKCDERKVKVFGEYEARTYEDKEMVNAVIQLAIDKINNFINKIK